MAIKWLSYHKSINIMSKEKEVQKGDKKKAGKNLKEKRADKKEKRETKANEAQS